MAFKTLALTAAAVLAAGLIVVRATEKLAEAILLDKNGKVVYSAWDGQDYEVFSINPDGTGRKQLTNNTSDDTEPTYSPDGRKIAFASERDGNAETYVMSADGANQTNLSSAPNDYDYSPTWAPDGIKIAYTKIDYDEVARIYVVNADGNNQKSLGRGSKPAWSPDGTKIAYSWQSPECGEEYPCLGSNIYTVDMNGVSSNALTGGGRYECRTYEPPEDETGPPGHPPDESCTAYRADEYSPAWSPDGSKIAFLQSEDDDESSEIYAMNSDGSSQTRLTSGAVEIDGPLEWSPDGTKIAFSRSPELYTINATGAGLSNLTNNQAGNVNPTFSPDGKKIAFENGKGEIYAANADGSNPTRVGDDVAHGSFDWGVLSEDAPPEPECTISGTDGNDVLEGTEGDDVICGLGGTDTLKGFGGNDTLKGGGGRDKLSGGPGDDILDGGSFSDTASYEDSATAIKASLTTNMATGEGNDTFTSIERLTGSHLADELEGSEGPDHIQANGGADTVSGLGGADVLHGWTGKDTLKGGTGNDTLQGGSGADRIFGDEDDDALNSKDGVSGNDSLDGGAGTNTCTKDATEASITNCQ